jgi:RNA polymerase sigma-70 factor (ECF subfamily)
MENHSREDENVLVEQAKTDPMAFGELYDRYYQKIFKYALNRTAEVRIAQDITSNTFYKAMTKLTSYKNQGIPFSAWLYKIASNEVVNHYRSKIRKIISLDFLFNEKHVEIANDYDVVLESIKEQAQVDQCELFKKVQQKLRKLPLIQQEIITLRYFEELQFNEISNITGKNINTVKSLLFRGLQKLNNLVSDLDIEFPRAEYDLQLNPVSHVVYVEES